MTKAIPGLNAERPDLRKTHPNLWRSILGLSIFFIALGLNFTLPVLIPSDYAHHREPTFQWYGVSNLVWGSIFLGLGLAKAFTLWRHLLVPMRVVMACEVAYLLFLVAGSTDPFVKGEGSLQLPITYLALALCWETPLMLEPFINPWTAKRQR